MKSPSPHAILEVERAISDLRRGEAVLLTGLGEALRLSSGEHWPQKAAVTDPKHPGVLLLKLAGLLPHAVLEKADHAQDGLLTVSAEAVQAYPAELATTLVKVSEADVPLKDAENARVIAFRPRFGHEEHLAVIIGDPQAQPAPYVRIHSSCVTGDVFGSLRCDCGSQLHKAVQAIKAGGGGVILYLSQEGRGIGIANKLRAYTLQDTGLDTVEANLALGFNADERDFAIAAAMLKQLNLQRITMLTNNPAKVDAIASLGITVAGRMPLVIKPNAKNEHYLDTKAQKMGHQF